VWRSLARVRIHIVDPRPHYRRMDNSLRRAWKMDNAPEALREMELNRVPGARELRTRMREMVADSLLGDSAPIRVQWLGRAMADPLGGMAPDKLSLFFGGRAEPEPLIDVSDFGRSGDRHLVGNIASWSAKASAAFHAALDVAKMPDENDFVTYRFDFGQMVCGRMIQELLPTHAFDKGNKAQIRLLENTRHAVLEQLAANEHFNRVIRQPSFPELESKGSYYIQAADFAAGIASDLYAKEELIGVVSRFEYVTYNGVRLSRTDAEETMRFEDHD
jgi:hypothetical protein